jgi:3-hydroxyisobutyrate dehydrogenase-like beta-hydroxyacid dehydrogenase
MTPTDVGPVGFVGLGNMGGALAANLVERGHDALAYDAVGSARCPEGATFVNGIAALARNCPIVVLSLPDGTASEAVCSEIAATEQRITTHVIDTSTIGLAAATTIDAFLTGKHIGYVDAPVSGGVAGAKARTLFLMYAGSDGACTAVESLLADLTDRRRRVGDRPGMAQALKLANNFLSATTLAATSEAIAFGVAAGLDMATMLEVLNESSGRSAATADKFPDHVLTGRYAAGFANTLMAKDLGLYREAVGAQQGPDAIATVTGEIWRRFADSDPGVDFTRIYPFVHDDGTGLSPNG